MPIKNSSGQPRWTCVNYEPMFSHARLGTRPPSVGRHRPVSDATEGTDGRKLRNVTNRHAALAGAGAGSG